MNLDFEYDGKPVTSMSSEELREIKRIAQEVLPTLPDGTDLAIRYASYSKELIELCDYLLNDLRLDGSVDK